VVGALGLGGAHEHLDEIVVQAGEELALKLPLELGMIEIARMQAEVVGMHRHGGVAEIDDDLDALALGTGVEPEQGMFVQPKLVENALQSRM
jgi:hypothetical protein